MISKCSRYYTLLTVDKCILLIKMIQIFQQDVSSENYHTYQLTIEISKPPKENHPIINIVTISRIHNHHHNIIHHHIGGIISSSCNNIKYIMCHDRYSSMSKHCHKKVHTRQLVPKDM